MRPHENLNLWQKAIEFVVEIYRVTEEFPTDEKFGLTSQLRRASVSIVANVAKGLHDDQQRNSGSFCLIRKVQQARSTPNWSSRTAWRILRSLTMNACRNNWITLVE